MAGRISRLAAAIVAVVALARCGSGTSSGPPRCDCSIDGACWQAGAASPEQACRACNPPLSSTSWSVADDGTACGAGVCSDGACVAATSTRTITLAFRTLYRPDDGSETEVAEAPPGRGAPVSLLVTDASGAYTTAAVTAAAPGTYTASGVPVGKYWLRMDRPGFVPLSDSPEGVACTFTELVPLVRSAPDLSTVLAARADLSRTTTSTPLTVSVSGLELSPLSLQLAVVSSQADSRIPGLPVFPASTGETSATLTFDWASPPFYLPPRAPGLPDASKGDVVFWFQRSGEVMQSGSASVAVRRATRFMRVDALSLQDGVPASVALPLGAAPETGSVATAARADLFAELAPVVNPSAEPLVLAVSVAVAPRSARFPDRPDGPFASIFSLTSDTRAAGDLGTFTYGRFLGAGWEEFRTVGYLYRKELAPQLTADAAVVTTEPASSPQLLPAVPVLTPPRAPRIGGADAFVAHAGVGTEPVLSWSPPATGTPTSYVVTVRAYEGLQPGDPCELRGTVYGGTSFRIPPGFLKAGVAYYALITARIAPWDAAARAPFRSGAPFATADCLTEPFTP